NLPNVAGTMTLGVQAAAGTFTARLNGATGPEVKVGDSHYLSCHLEIVPAVVPLPTFFRATAYLDGTTFGNVNIGASFSPVSPTSENATPTAVTVRVAGADGDRAGFSSVSLTERGPLRLDALT